MKVGRPGYVLRVSSPPIMREQLQVAAALLQGAAVIIVPHRCNSVEEWLARYGRKTHNKSDGLSPKT